MKRGRYSVAGPGGGSEGAKIESIDQLYRRLIGQDDGALPLPPVGSDPHLLTSRVRKHYFDSVIKLLCVNYENSQKMLGKNIRLPSAIWRCAKYIELQAVQACMLMQLYRENMISVIKQLKADTDKGKLYKNLFECLLQPPSNDKGTQVNIEPKPNMIIKKRKRSLPEFNYSKEQIPETMELKKTGSFMTHNNQQYQIPVLVNVQSDNPALIKSKSLPNVQKPEHVPVQWDNTVAVAPKSLPTVQVNGGQQIVQIATPNTPTCDVQPVFTPNQPATPMETNNRLSIESLEEDQVMLQMEQIFRTEETEDDLFEGTLCNNFDFLTSHDSNFPEIKAKNGVPSTQITEKPAETVVENMSQSGSVNSLDERIELLKSSGVLAPTVTLPKESPKSRKSSTSKWVCELYFQRLKLSETLDLIIENNRRKHARIQKKFVQLFGEDDDDDLMMSPMDETAEFISSCNERIAPFVVKNLMPYYNRGRIKTKALFKSVAKHIIDSIIAHNKFPDEYEVFTFITDYFKARSVIRCSADYNF